MGARSLGTACAVTWDTVPGASAAITSTPVPDLEFVTFLVTFSEDVLVSELPGEVESGFHAPQVGPLVTKAGGPEGPAGPRAVLQSTSCAVQPESRPWGPACFSLGRAACPLSGPGTVAERARTEAGLYAARAPPRDLVPLPPRGTFVCSLPPHLRGSGHGGRLAALRAGQTDFHPGPLHSRRLPGRLLPGPRHGHPRPLVGVSPRPPLCSCTISPRVLVPLPRHVSLLSTQHGFLSLFFDSQHGSSRKAGDFACFLS